MMEYTRKRMDEEVVCWKSGEVCCGRLQKEKEIILYALKERKWTDGIQFFVVRNLPIQAAIPSIWRSLVLLG
jgi:hypothetical protein